MTPEEQAFREWQAFQKFKAQKKPPEQFDSTLRGQLAPGSYFEGRIKEWHEKQKETEQPKKQVAPWSANEMRKQADFYDRLDFQKNTPIQNLLRDAGLGIRATLKGAPAIIDTLTDIGRIPYAKMTGHYPPGLSQMGGELAERLSLPTPLTPSERIGEMVTETAAGGGGLLGIGGKVKALSPLVDDGARQLAAMAGAGLGAGSAREADMPAPLQVAAGLAGAFAAPAAMSKVVNILHRSGIPTMFSAMKGQPVGEEKILMTLKSHGVNTDAMSKAVKDSLVRDVKQALYTGADLDAAALARLAKFRTLGLQPTRGPVTRQPAAYTAEQNAMRTSSASGDVNAPLPRIYQDNERKLVQQLNALGANTSDDMVDTGAKAIGAIRARNAAATAKQRGLYGAARDVAGRGYQQDREQFFNSAINTLKKENRYSQLPDAWKNTLKDLMKKDDNGDYIADFTIDSIDSLKTDLATAIRQKSGAEKFALTAVKRALDDVEITAPSKAAMDAANKARRFSRAKFAWQDSAPGIKAALDDVNPDTFMEKFVIGKSAGVGDVEKMLKTVKRDPQAYQSMREQLAKWIKSQALTKETDELGVFKHAGLKNALDKIGDKKLRLFLSNDEFQTLKDIKDVSGYIQVQPPGSAVNNSNTAAMLTAKLGQFLDRIASAIPGGQATTSIALGMARPVINSGLAGYRGMRAQNIPLTIDQAGPGTGAARLIYPGLLFSAENN